MLQHTRFSSLVQLCLALQCLAAPIAESTDQDNAWEYGTSHGIIGLAVLILDVIVFGKLTERSARRLRIWPVPVLLTLAVSSRGPAVQPRAVLETHLVPRRLSISHRGHVHLLGLLEPRRAQHPFRLPSRRLIWCSWVLVADRAQCELCCVFRRPFDR